MASFMFIFILFSFFVLGSPLRQLGFSIFGLVHGLALLALHV